MHAGTPIPTFSDSPRMIPLRMPWWYRADFVHLVGSKADVVKDLSGNGADQLQSTDANRWVWSATSGPKSTPGLTGTGSQFSSTASNINLTTATQLTSIFVCTPNNLDVAGTDYLGQLSDATNASESIEYEAGINAGQDGFEVIMFDSPFANSSAAISDDNLNVPTIVEFTADQTIATNQVNVWINGVLGAQSRPFNQTVAGGFQNLLYFLGKNFNIPTQCWKGVIAENFAYVGLLTTQQRKSLYRGYLGPRYGIVVP